MKLSFTVPGVPVPCGRARIGFGGRHTFTPKKTRDYKAHARTCAASAVEQHERWPTVRPAYSVRLEVYRAAKRGDWDNFAKGILDACNGVVFIDDRLIIEAHVFLYVDKVNPRVEVEVEAL